MSSAATCAQSLVRLLRRARFRSVLERTVRSAWLPSLVAVGLLAGAALGCSARIGVFRPSLCRTVLGPTGLSAEAWFSLLSCFAVIWAVSGVWACFRQRGVSGLARMARLLDSRLVLADRLATAWWLTQAQPLPGSLERAVLSDAGRLARTLDLAKALPLRGLWSVGLCPLLASLGLWFLPVLSEAPLPSVLAESERTSPPAAAWLAEEVGSLEDPERQPTEELVRLSESLQQALRRSVATGGSSVQAFQALQQVGSAADRIARAVAAAMQARAQALAESPQSQEAADALRRRDFEAAARSLEGLSEQARKRPGTNGSLSRSLAAAAQAGSAPAEGSSSSARALSRALQRAAKALSDRREGALREGAPSQQAADALAESAAQLRQAGREWEAASALRRKAGAAQESLRQRAQAAGGYGDRLERFSRNARGRASKSGPSDRRGETSASGSASGAARPADGSDGNAPVSSQSGARGAGARHGSGPGTGSGPDPGAGASPARSRGSRRVMLDSVDNGRGATHSQSVSGDAVQSAARHGFARPSYRDAYRPYRRVAERVLEGEAIPAGYVPTVRRYFELIQPRSTAP